MRYYFIVKKAKKYSMHYLYRNVFCKLKKMLERTCRISGEKFVIEKDDLEFYGKRNVITAENLSDLLSGKISDCAGLPTLCPAERQRRRLSWRNERKLYKRKCDATEKDIISMYDGSSIFSIYEQKYWWSDNWDALDYGQEFDFSKSFFEQFKALQKKVPRIALHVMGNENSSYVNSSGYSKNCYLSYQTDYSEGCLYCSVASHSTDCVDCLMANKSELCYESINSNESYGSYYLFDSKNCSDSWFLKNCIGCKNCFGCVNLRNKEYYFLNKKLSKEEYDKKIKLLNLSCYSAVDGMRKKFFEFVKIVPQKFVNVINSEDFSGDGIYNSKLVKNCFDCFACENCKYCASFEYSSNCHDYDMGGYSSEWCYEIGSGGDKNFQTSFSINIWGKVSNSFYCSVGKNLSNCFGCIGLRQKKYCILNKQYTKEEYEELVPKIIEHMKKTGEWGEFFPTSMSPFAYNETVANEYFGLTKEEAERNGYIWKEEKQTVQYTGPKYEIPDDIKDVPDEILEKVLQCERSGKFFRIQKAELKFYRKMNLPIPRLHPDERHKDRMKLRNPRKLWKRKCDDCNCEIQTTFAPERPEKILCEDCYLKIVD